MKRTLVVLCVLFAVSASASGQPGEPPKPGEPPATGPAGPVTPPGGEKAPASQPASKPATKPRVLMETTLGGIVLELDAEKAPITVENFLRYVNEGYYVGTIFHRVIPDFMIQGGGYTAEMDIKKEGLRPPIKIESNNRLKNVRGTISMARTGDPNSATSQFFINVVDNTRKLDYRQGPGREGYTVFGEVAQGMDVVELIRTTKTRMHPKYDPRQGEVTPVEPVVIKSIRLMKEGEEYKPPAPETKPAPPPAKPVAPPPPPPPPPPPAEPKPAPPAPPPPPPPPPPAEEPEPAEEPLEPADPEADQEEEEEGVGEDDADAEDPEAEEETEDPEEEGEEEEEPVDEEADEDAFS